MYYLDIWIRFKCKSMNMSFLALVYSSSPSFSVKRILVIIIFLMSSYLAHHPVFYLVTTVKVKRSLQLDFRIRNSCASSLAQLHISLSGVSSDVFVRGGFKHTCGILVRSTFRHWFERSYHGTAVLNPIMLPCVKAQNLSWGTLALHWEWLVFSAGGRLL